MPDTKQGEASQSQTISEPAIRHSSNDTPANTEPLQSKPETLEVHAGAVPTLKPEVSPPEDRSELLARARTFLASPQVQNQDIPVKRAFLAEKGLNQSEIESLLLSLPVQPPTIPPRTYPQPPPSNLPILLLGILRLFTWLAGGSAVLVLLYRRFLLPRIAATSLARHSIKSHQLSLLKELTTCLASLKETQSKSFSVLPHPNHWKESKKYAKCNSVAEIVNATRDAEKEVEFSNLSEISVLRCALKEIGKTPTTEELFRFLEEKIPWLLTEEGTKFEQQLWDTLSTCPLFGRVASSLSTSNIPLQAPESTPPTQWEYIPPVPVSLPPVVKSLDVLSSELPKNTQAKKSPFQHTLQTMSDFTGYLSTQVYLPYRPAPVGMGIPSASGQTTIEEELRREIRALKGLVLNRRSFMPSIPRAGVASPARTIP